MVCAYSARVSPLYTWASGGDLWLLRDAQCDMLKRK